MIGNSIDQSISIDKISPEDKIGKTKSDPVFSTQRIYRVPRVIELPTYPTLPFCVIVSTQHVRVEALLFTEYKVQHYFAAVVGNFSYKNFTVKARCDHFPFFC